MKKKGKHIKINMSKKAFAVTIRVFRAAAVIVVVFGALFLSARLLGKTAVSNVTDSITMVKYLFTHGDGYPYKMEELNSRYVDSMDNEIIILYNDHSHTLSAHAVPMLSLQTESSNTVLKVNNGRALIVDRTENTLTLQSKTEQLGTVELDNSIITASIGGNGCFAAATYNSIATSTLTVYDRSLEAVFSWNCSNERITDVALSKSGKTVAVSVAGVKDAVIYSRLIVFDVDSPEPVGELRFDGTFLLKTVFTSRGRVIAVGDNMTVVTDKKCQKLGEFTYTEDTLSHAVCDDNGNTVICVSEFGGSKTRLTRIDSSGNTDFDKSIDGNIGSVDVLGSKTAVLNGTKVDYINTKGEASKSVTLGSSADKIMLAGNALYTVEKGEICKY